MKTNQKIFLYGGKSTAFLVQEILKERKKKIFYIFDKYINEKPHFETQAIFSNKQQDLLLFLKKSKYFFVCIGMMDGKLRYYISKKIQEHKLKEISVLSKESCIDKSVEYGPGLLAMPHCVVNKKTIIGSNCYLNVNSVIDHECKIGNGVHVMGSAYIAGRVTIGDFSSIGANATILPDISIGTNAIVGAGAVVIKDVPNNSVVVGNPAKFLRKNNKKYDFNI
jgi:sugar O-acyltransferase (sialic acid O-acetyltransferase NeuD family)